MTKPLTNLIHELVHLMDEEADKVLASHKLPFRQFHMLAVLAEVEPTTQRRWAGSMGYTDAGISKAVHTLVQKNLIRVSTDPRNPRRNQVSLTPEGKKITAKYGKILENEFKTIVRQSKKDPEVLKRVIESINKVLLEKRKERNI